MIQQITSLFSYIKPLRGEMKKSRFKIWLRAFLFFQFSAMFSFYFFHDIGNGYFSWGWVALLFTLFIPVGFLMSLIVPMKADLEIRAVTLSLDRVYLFWRANNNDRSRMTRGLIFSTKGVCNVQK